MNLTFLSPFQIVVSPSRQRQVFDQKKIAELALSIEREGLVHPLAIEEINGCYTLLAGERRLRAMQILHGKGTRIRIGNHEALAGTVPCIVYKNLDTLSRHAVELMENIQRENLTWQEHSVAVSAYHALRGQQKAPEGLKQTITATVAEIGKIKNDTVALALAVSKHLHDPEVAKAKDLREAAKIVERKAGQAHRAVLARTFDLSKTPHTLLKGDFRVELAGTSPGQFDVLITDPPYGVGADSFGSQASTGHAYGDDPDQVWELLDSLAETAFRLLKQESFAYVFCDIRAWPRLSTLFSLAGFTCWPRPLIWDKCGNGMLPEPDYGPRNTYECILYARKGTKKIQRIALPDVLSHAPVRKLTHGAEKPVNLYVDLLSRVCLPGQRILDTCAGSGVVFRAANKLKLIATACEKDEDSYNLALAAMGGEVEVEPPAEPADDLDIGEAA